MKKTLHALLLVLLLVSATAYGQANLSFSGGNGSPFTFTLSQPVTYTINIAGTGPFFIFQNVGNAFSGGGGTITSSSVTYRINGGALQSFSNIASNSTFGNVTPNDLYLYGSNQALAVGAVVTLQAGTFTTTNNITNPAPAGGSFSTFIAESSGFTRVSPNGVAVPEPQPVALALLGGAGLLLSSLLRRNRAQV